MIGVDLWAKMAFSPYRRKLVTFCIIAIPIIFLPYQASQAQDPPHPIVTFAIDNLSWSRDSRQLVFQGGYNESGVITVSESWHIYDVGTDELTHTYHWPFQPNLTPEQIEAFEIATTDEGQVSFVFPSPDSRYLIYAAQTPVEWGNSLHPIGIADLEIGDHLVFSDMIVQSLENFSLFYRVYWSANSTAFTVEVLTTFGGEQRPYYFSGLENGLSNMTRLSLLYDDIVFLENDDDSVVVASVFDLSCDGDKVLLETLSNTSGSDLFLWNTSDPSQSQILAEHIQSAIFLEDNDHQIVYFNRDGFKLVDLETGQSVTSEMGRLEIPFPEQVWIAPNGQYAALYDNSEISDAGDLYVVKIEFPNLE